LKASNGTKSDPQNRLISAISPGIIITPLAKDELTGPRGAGYRRMIDQCMHGLTRRNVDNRRAYLVSGFAEDLPCGVGIFFAQVCEQHMLARTHAPGDRLTDRSWSDDDNNFVHSSLLQGCGLSMYAARKYEASTPKLIRFERISAVR